MAVRVQYQDVDWYDFFIKRGLVSRAKRQRKNKGNEVVNVIAAFDIESSTVYTSDDNTDAHSFMYVWMFAIEDYLVKGRTWDEWFDFLMVLMAALERCREEWKLAKKPSLITWIHNAAYEFSFISGLYPFKNEEIFFRDVRKPIYFRMFDCFEFRCSYIQSNMSLAALTRQTGVKVKLSGQKYDYNRVRFPWTPLTEFEEEYTDTDVISLVDAMRIRIAKGGDSLLTVPLTSTGYVRRECKEALKDSYLDILDIKPWRVKPDKNPGDHDGYDVYRLLRDAFRGGNTHANRFYVGQVCNDVYSYDIASSYPTQQLTQKFPMKQFKFLTEPTVEKCCMYIGLGYAVVGRFRFTNIRLKNKREPMPYISLSRCQAQGFSLDNGRILKADYLEIALTEIDLEIILKQYVFDGKMQITECMIAQKDYLPASYRRVIQDYYDKKTILKGAETDDEKYQYARSKELLNAVYGMSATSASGEIVYTDGEYFVKTLPDMAMDEIQKRLKSLAFCYQWGVYTTALARKQLQDAIDLCGDKIIYCDTDSVKTLGDAPIHKLNEALQQRAENMGAYAYDRKGRNHPIGVFEFDGHYKQFITQGAKRYAYIDDDNKMHVTVSGVTKKVNEETGIPFAVEELKTLTRFKPGMIWRKAGGTAAVYNDNDDFDYEDPETGKKVHIGKNVAIIPSTYEMTYSRDYAKLLYDIKGYKQFKDERM